MICEHKETEHYRFYHEGVGFRCVACGEIIYVPFNDSFPMLEVGVILFIIIAFVSFSVTILL